jgi:hypothetical protein
LPDETIVLLSSLRSGRGATVVSSSEERSSSSGTAVLEGEGPLLDHGITLTGGAGADGMDERVPVPYEAAPAAMAWISAERSSSSGGRAMGGVVVEG